MLTSLNLIYDPITVPASLSADANSASTGALITFWGIVRDTENGCAIWGLEYTAFEGMARHQFEILFQTASERWPIASIRLIHRLGRVPAGVASLWIEVGSPHRAEAFAACQWIIDEMKLVVPIWKRAIP